MDQQDLLTRQPWTSYCCEFSCQFRCCDQQVGKAKSLHVPKDQGTRDTRMLPPLDDSASLVTQAAMTIIEFLSILSQQVRLQQL